MPPDSNAAQPPEGAIAPSKARSAGPCGAIGIEQNYSGTTSHQLAIVRKFMKIAGWIFQKKL